MITEEMSQDIASRLNAHIPFFLKLHPDERKLESTYHLRNIPPRPNAIHNLFSLGGVELSELAVDFQNGNIQSLRTKLFKAQRKITEVLKQRWTASNLEMQLRHESEFVYIDIVNSINHDVVDIRERSEGFQWFLCVIAALEGVRTNTSHPAILLIDEADNHLHYEAQAKLANFLSHQTLAQHVIYTTHSPGCLPDDLSAVRAVIPNDDNTSSRIESRVWNGKGKDFKRFFWLLGAKNFAFTAARNVLISEGEADFVLLPYLFREALGTEALNFQILPGLANAKEKDSFELEAVTVAYLVDGDAPGDEYITELEAKGIPKNRIFQFEKDLALEDYLNLDLYSQAVNKELDFAKSGLEIDRIELEKPNRSAIVSKFAKQNGVEVSKRSIAEVFLTLQNELESQGCLIASDRPYLIEIAKSLAELFSETKSRTSKP
jgi:predicted ATP-dependent endonuclease of OLD family